MNILIESGNTNSNWGDSSMLQVAISRLQELFPDSLIHLLGHSEDPLTQSWNRVRHVHPKGRQQWFLHYGVLGPLQKRYPALIDRTYRAAPGFMSSLSDLKLQLKGTSNRPRDAFLSTFKRADLLVISGMGGINDVFEYSCRRILSIINLAQAWDVPVFLFGQGIGPIQNPQIRDKARRLLPLAAQIALREKKYSFSLLRELGYSRDQIVVTGDDAVSLAYEQRPEELGSSIGVNLRRASYSGLGTDVEHTLTDVLNDLCDELSTSLRPVPISHGGDGSDVETVQRILSKCGVESDGGASFTSPVDVIRSAGQCRIVVTGSYHGGVFALSQGVPVVAISNSSYYDAKFEGLADQFGGGCAVIRADDPNFSSKVHSEIRRLWDQANTLRPKLLSAAKSQGASQRKAYNQLRTALRDD